MLDGLTLAGGRRGLRRADGPVGLGQDDAAEPDRRHRPADERRDHRRGPEISRALRGASSPRGAAAHVGFIFQFYNLIPVLTAFENVELPLLLTHLSKKRAARARAHRARVVGLADRYEALPAAAVGRPGAARRHRARHRHRSGRARRRRADRRPRREERRGHSEPAPDAEHGVQKTIVMVTHDPRAAARAHLERISRRACSPIGHAARSRPGAGLRSCLRHFAGPGPT